MLITCFQCRQQLDVPEDSAGKRVRCPHCSYVIVVPTKSRTSVEANEPATALPSLELDGDGPAPTEKKIPSHPLPPMPLPPVEAERSKNKPPLEDLPPAPSIDRSRRRRGPSESAPTVKGGSGKVLWILGIIGALGLGAVLGAIVASDLNRHNRQPNFAKVAFQPPAPPVQIPQFQMPPMQPINPLNQHFMPGQPALEWQEFQNYERRFKAQFHAAPVATQMAFQQGLMTGFEARLGEWGFRVVHRALTEEQFKADTVGDHFRAIETNLTDQGWQKRGDQGKTLHGVHPGHEWDFLAPGNVPLLMRSFLIRDGNRYHFYVLTVQNLFNGPVDRNRHEVVFFFNSFVPLVGVEGTNDQIGQTIFEEIDDVNQGGRRENEFLTLAVHPTKQHAVAGTVASQIYVVPHPGQRQFGLGDQMPIEQVVISPEGNWLAVSTGKAIHFSQEWDAKQTPGKRSSVPGLRCAVTKDHRLLVVSKNDVKAYDLHTSKWVTTLDVKDMNLQGLALSADGRTLALHDEKSIALWKWPEKKLLGRFDAHDAAITALVYSPDGKTLASASVDRTIKLWDVETRTESATLKQHAWTVASLAFTPDGKHLVSGGLDGLLLVWDLQPDEPTVIWAQAHQFPVRGVAFDADGKHCYLTCKQPVGVSQKEGQRYRRQLRKIKWSDIKANREQAEKIVAQHAGLHLPTGYGAVHVSRDGGTIVTTSDTLNVGFGQPPQQHLTRIWDGATGRHKHAFNALIGGVLSPDGKWLAFAPPGDAAVVKVMEVATRRVSDTLVQTENAAFPFALFAPDSRSLWLYARHELMQFGMPAQKMTKKGMGNIKLKLPFLKELKFKEPNDSRVVIVTPSLDQKSFLVDVGSFDEGLFKRTLHASADGQELPLPKIAAGERSEFLRMRRHNNDHIALEDILEGNAVAIGRQAAFNLYSAIHPDRKIAATDSTGKNRFQRVHLWDLDERRPLLTLPQVGARGTSALRFSPDGRYLICVTSAGWTRIVPTDWLLERKALLASNPNEVTAP